MKSVLFEILFKNIYFKVTFLKWYIPALNVFHGLKSFIPHTVFLGVDMNISLAYMKTTDVCLS